jgi:hypothetical protein
MLLIRAPKGNKLSHSFSGFTGEGSSVKIEFEIILYGPPYFVKMTVCVYAVSVTLKNYTETVVHVYPVFSPAFRFYPGRDMKG